MLGAKLGFGSRPGRRRPLGWGAPVRCSGSDGCAPDRQGRRPCRLRARWRWAGAALRGDTLLDRRDRVVPRRDRAWAASHQRRLRPSTRPGLLGLVSAEEASERRSSPPVSAGRAGRRGGPRAGCDDALRQPPCRRPRRLVRPGGRRVLPACLYVLGLAACHAPTLSVSSSASIAASSAWVWMRPSATSWPPDRRTAEANGPAQVFS